MRPTLPPAGFAEQLPAYVYIIIIIIIDKTALFEP
jgi:hypothetical protein